jgi:hypothetical protein
MCLCLLGRIFYFILRVILSTSANKGGQINLSVILVMDLIKHFWYLIHVEQQEETVIV